MFWGLSDLFRMCFLHLYYDHTGKVSRWPLDPVDGKLSLIPSYSRSRVHKERKNVINGRGLGGAGGWETSYKRKQILPAGSILSTQLMSVDTKKGFEELHVLSLYF